jgi:hypothetical protein
MLKKFVTNMFFVNPANKLSYAQLIEKLYESKKNLTETFKAKADSSKNREVITHIIGIERWSQTRLAVFLGTPMPKDEYDGYRPSSNVTKAKLIDLFTHTRDHTLAICQQLATLDIPASQTVNHNQYDAFNSKSWMYYMLVHSNLESKKMR